MAMQFGDGKASCATAWGGIAAACLLAAVLAGCRPVRRLAPAFSAATERRPSSSASRPALDSPLAVGTRWVYLHRHRGVGRPRHSRWTTAHTVVSVRASTSGVLVTQRIVRSGGDEMAALWNYGDWLIRSHCLFAVQPNWLTSRASLRGRTRSAFQRGDMRALACAPLRVGHSWGGQRRYFRTWVEGLGPASLGPLRFSPWAASAFRIHWKYVQGPVQIWYRPGVGITDERYRHAGAYGRYSVRLVDFHAGDDPLSKSQPKTD
jgi:hypothetical protein